MRMRIGVDLELAGTLHIGVEKTDSEDIKNPIIKIKRNGKYYPVVPPYAIKGALRRIAFRIANGILGEKIEKIPLDSGINHDESSRKLNELGFPYHNHPFYALFGAEDVESKIWITNSYAYGANGDKSDVQINVRPRIRVNRIFKSVEHGALFNMEIAEVKGIHFDIIAQDLSIDEKALLYASLKALRYSTVGGHGATGSGVVECVIIKDDGAGFIKEAEQYFLTELNTTTN